MNLTHQSGFHEGTRVRKGQKVHLQEEPYFLWSDHDLEFIEGGEITGDYLYIEELECELHLVFCPDSDTYYLVSD
jgi:hypothetical protein